MANLPLDIDWLTPFLDVSPSSANLWGAIGQLRVRFTPPLVPEPNDLPMMLMRSIGAGGMGAALLVLDPRQSDARMCVCKVIAPAGERIRFDNEIRLHEQIRHPNIVRGFGAAEIILHEDRGKSSPTVSVPAYFMEYIQGGSLRDLLKSGRQSPSRRVPIREAFRMTGQIIDALETIHRHGVIHRDLKPANILLDISDGRAARICDLGIAKETPVGCTPSPSTVTGTWGYNAPEFLSVQPLSSAADYFSLGCVLLEMLTGVPAFARTPGATANQAPNGLADVEKHYDLATRTLIEDLLKKDPAQRLSDPMRIRHRIEGILSSNLKIATSLWKDDWPPHDRDAKALGEFAVEEKSWFGSGKLQWAGCLIGLHSRRRTLSEFSVLISELQGRLFKLATPLAAAESSQDASDVKLQRTCDEFVSNLRYINDWLDVLLTESLKRHLSFLEKDQHLLKRFQFVIRELQLEDAKNYPGAPKNQVAVSSHADLMSLIHMRLEQVCRCWRQCSEISNQIHDNIVDCSDQLVSAVALVK